MRSRRLVVWLLALPVAAVAQQPFPTTTVPPASIVPIPFDTAPRGRGRAPRDSTVLDSTKAPREIVKWAETDSVMQSLMDRPGYTATRYQGNTVYLDAPRRDLTVDGHAAVQRDKTVLVADTIFYSDTLHMLRATAPAADTITLRDPSQGTADLTAQGFLEYDLKTHRGLVSSLSTSSRQSGETWYVYGHQAAIVGDTTGSGHNTSYAEGGSITSCDLAVPHYHFQSSEMKVVSGTIMVARPAVLYVADVPVLWLPFIFQDMRRGRRSGMLTPRFGIADIVRTTPTYRRQIENIGYYFAINDYMDALAAIDWRSGADAGVGSYGFTRLNYEWRFHSLDHFIRTDLRTTYTSQTNGLTEFDVNMIYTQQFSQNRTVNANLQYTSNSDLYHNNAVTVAQALAAITSSVAYQDRLGPFAMSLGGSRIQQSGQPQVTTQFPTLSVSSQPITVMPGVLWTPALSVTSLGIDHVNGAPYNYAPGVGGSLDSAIANANTRQSSFALQTPFRIGAFALPITVSVSDVQKNIEQNYLVYDFNTGKVIGQRTYGSTFRTDAKWETGVALPGLSQGKWNVTPFVTIANADPSAGYWVRTEQTAGLWVAQTKTIQTGLAIQPTFYGFFPGFGPFSRIRHAFQPRISYSYAPASNVSDEFLRALNYTRFGYLGGLTRSNVSFQLLNTVEAKLRPRGDSAAAAASGGDKVKLLSLNLSPLTYDFVVASKIGRGITTPTFHWDAQSDLLPGFQISADYSLFAGDPISNTAHYDPFRTGLSISFNIGRTNNPFAAFSRIFGGPGGADSGIAATANAIAPGGGAFLPTPIAGAASSRVPLAVQRTGGWNLSVIFTETESRPVTGANVRTFDPLAYCAQFKQQPDQYNRCLQLLAPIDTLPTTTAGAPVIVQPPRKTLRANAGFALTPHWAVQWTTGYDLITRKFSDNVISLQRELHDWHAVFAFTQSPNGYFAFNFFISLTAEPDLRFDYNRRNYPPQATVTP